MDKVLLDVAKNASCSIDAHVGSQILDVITSGMYNDPLMILREYIQNAVDSIDEAVENNIINLKEGVIRINVSGRDRVIQVIDNGTGISNKEVERKLGGLGISSKKTIDRRGFRGIGRLGGLAYCDILRFETRSHAKEFIAVVEWDNSKLKALNATSTSKKYSLDEAILKVATIKYRKSHKEDASRFFKVELINVQKFHRDILMDLKAIRTYLSQVAPISYCDEFTYSEKINSFFKEEEFKKITRTYNIFVNEELLYRPYKNEIMISGNVTDTIKDIELIKLTNDEEVTIGVGWFAVTSFATSFPKTLAMRGIRVRHGNIEVGNERFLDDIFTEKRFSTWQIGEIHLNHTIKPNARRDGFEQNSDYEKFLEQVNVLGRKLSHMCRQSSIDRSKRQKEKQAILQMRKKIKSSNIFVDSEHYKKFLNLVGPQVETIAYHHKNNEESLELQTAFDQMKKRSMILAECIDGQSLSNLTKIELLQNFCRKIIDFYSPEVTIEEILHNALDEYLKK